ncbi:hypothetical protein [Frigoribacterium sp. PvP032]|uniref:hypothetical protein n=1 Tax=Frigoribacterium sp. PvP032 TaxID=2806589 RepID=UPI001AE47E99|nr:hypothetical protein [Frigoribacterium sp. PvP032]MBP1189523.1 hypothetical protein [Frigoribacterium sp. PvP032]
MPRRPLEPAPGTSETALRRAVLIQLVIQGALGILVFSPLLLGGGDDTDVFRLWLLAVWGASFVALVARFRSLGSWRADPVRGDETMLWGTSAVLVRPTGGVGYGGRFSLSTHRLRYTPGLIASLRGATPEEWPTRSLTGAHVTPSSGRAWPSAYWAVIGREHGNAIALVSTEPRAVATEIDRLIREQLSH